VDAWFLSGSDVGITAPNRIMADHNNDRAGTLPDRPAPALKSLERLIGRWKVTGTLFEGSIAFEWMEGGFFLVQHVDARARSRPIRGIEYIGFDEETGTLRSHYMDDHGANFVYTWETEGDLLRIWLGGKDSTTRFEARFSPDGESFSGRWQWPGGGYAATATRVRG
jgi:hypothetical protein